MKQFTQLLNRSLSHVGVSSTVLFITPGRHFTVGHRLTMTITMPHPINQPAFIGPDDFAFEARFSGPTVDHAVMLRPGDLLDMKQWSPLVLWPVAVDVDIDTRQVQSIALKMVAMDESVLFINQV